MKTVKFKYDIGDRVRVEAVEMCGRIEALMADIQGNMYRVLYWNDGQRYSQWVYDWEITGA